VAGRRTRCPTIYPAPIESAAMPSTGLNLYSTSSVASVNMRSVNICTGNLLKYRDAYTRGNGAAIMCVSLERLYFQEFERSCGRILNVKHAPERSRCVRRCAVCKHA